MEFEDLAEKTKDGTSLGERGIGRYTSAVGDYPFPR
jgi:hypothetical protein